MPSTSLVRLFLYASFVWRSQAGGLAKTLKAMADQFDTLSPAEHLTDVGVGIYFDHLYTVDDKTNRFTCDFYLSLQWFDPRWATNSGSGGRRLSPSAAPAGLDWTHDFIDKGLTEHEDAECDASAGHSSSGSGGDSSSGSGGHRRLSPAPAPSPAAPGDGTAQINFLELGHDELKLVWMPDLHIRNLYKNTKRTHSEMLRIYPDGKFELITFIWAVLEMQDAAYSLYPYDEQDLPIIIESLSHSNSRITMHPLHELTGLEVSLTHHWPGWEYLTHSEEKSDVEPEYAHGNPCRKERKARINFNIHVRRNFDRLTLIPLLLLVVASWAGFFIKITALMPRVATGFISYLTINNIAQARLAAIPAVNYAVWISVLLDLCRFGVFLSVVETVAAQFLFDVVGSRVSKRLDIWARFVVPVDFIVILIVLLNVDDVESIKLLADITKLNMLFVILTSAFFVEFTRRSLVKKLRKDPLSVYGDGEPPLDIHDCRQIFDAITDLHNPHEQGHVVDASEIAEYLIQHTSGLLQDDLKDKTCVLQDRLEKKIGNGPLTLEMFVGNHKAIFVELRKFKYFDLAPKQSKKTDAPLDKEAPPAAVDAQPQKVGDEDNVVLTAKVEQLTTALAGLHEL